MGEIKKSFLSACMFLIIAAFLSGCAGVAPVKVEPIPPSEHPTEHLLALEKELNASRQDQLNVLAPDSFSEAERYYEAARTGIDTGGSLGEIMDSIANGRAQITRAREAAKLSRTALPDLIKAREFARAAGAPTFEKEYAEVEERFLDLTRAVERNDLKTAQRKKDAVAESFRQLELKAIKDQYIGEVRSLIAGAEKEGAKKHAPKTLKASKETLEEADTFISENPYRKEEVISKASGALFQAQRLRNVNAQSMALRDMEYEDMTLWVEGMVEKITSQLEAPDMRNEPFDTQVENILGSVAALQDDHRFLDGTVKELQAENAELKRTYQSEVETLKAEQKSALESLGKKSQAELEAANKKHNDDTEALKKQHLDEVLSMTKQIAALEGKSREEQAELARLEKEKRAAEEKLKAEQQAAQVKLEAERLVAREKLESSERAAKEKLEQEKLAAREKLESEQRFHKLYTETQNLFSADEAEVHRKGNQLVIRLRAMRFPVGKAVIMPENYALLSKVQRAIRTFGEPMVVIEGHTDSTGPDTLNEYLSQQRADSVRKYFIANNVLTEAKTMSVGYGSKRPLASNETAEGRATNRRIDILITPETMQAP